MVKKPVFDTSVFPSNAKEIENQIIFCLFPTIVFYELIATSTDDSTLQKYERWQNLHKKNKSLINPSSTDWWETSKAIRRLYLMKAAAQTKLKTLRNDALIARLAATHDAFVVTHDVDDFQLVQKAQPKLEVVSADEFFN